MPIELISFLTSFFLITIAEIGDKTQLLIIGMAKKENILKILLGVAIGTLLSHGIVIFLGGYISNFSKVQFYLQLIAYTSFILFGVLSFIKKKDEETKQSNISVLNYGVVLPVALSIFIGELGDKTQLASITLSTKYPNCIIPLILGAISGMILADLIGIIIGLYMRKKLPEKTISTISSIAFILFGIIGLISILK